MQFKAAFGTDIGRKRAQNQDHGAALPELGLFIVSDGMGGHRGGETASATAVDVITSFVRKAEKQKNWDARKLIIAALEAANLAIYEKAITSPELQGMGTTTTALLFKEGALTIGHVGDSRCYFFRPHAIWQATRDHSLVQEKLRAGLISRDEVKTDQMKNVITRSVGFEKDVNVETYFMEVQVGDCFLLCSDGLSGLVDDIDILKTVQKHLFEEGDIQKVVDELISNANANGGDDNITTVMVQVT
jgi:serine/threonine protein phosphatase PrpC